jgi:predicted CoA-binding protein
MNDISEILKLKTIAVVGCSPKLERPSHYVSAYLQEAGYKIIPVNPGHSQILDEKCYACLLEIPHKIDTVLIFRRAEYVFSIVQDAIQIKAKAVWMQDGIEDFRAARLAKQAGLKVVMNDCMMRQHQAHCN